MALNNFEKQIQQKLNNREIKPSANSWDRLDAMLSVEEKPKKKGFFWINIAASFIVFASIGFYFYNQNEVLVPAKEDSIIVEVEEKNEIKNQKSEIIEISVDEVLVENDSESKIRQQKSDNRNQTINKDLDSPIINQGVSIINQSSEKPIVLNSKTNIQKPTNTNKYISAEKLLAEVSNTKFETKSSNKNINKRISVNPNTLLSNAEEEIYESYRVNALERLNKNFNSIKTVLVNRNYEDEL